jgi:hypothetical protein
MPVELNRQKKASSQRVAQSVVEDGMKTSKIWRFEAKAEK